MPSHSAAIRSTPDEDYSSVSVTTASAQDPYVKFRKAYDTPAGPGWQPVVFERLSEITNLTRNWNGYADEPIRFDTAFFALKVLSELMEPRTPIPQVVPSSLGGVQFEWHERDIDLELHFVGPYECEVWFADLQSGNQISIDLTSDFSSLRAPIHTLSRR